MKKLLIPLLLATLFAGCSSFPTSYSAAKHDVEVLREATESWSNAPAITYIKSTAGVLITQHTELAEDLAQKKINFEFTPGVELSIDDFAQALRAQGIKVSIRLPKTKIKDLGFKKFKGNLGDLLESVAQMHNIAFESRKGVLIFIEASRFSVALPQHKALLDSVAESLKERGATAVRADLQAGLIYYDAKPDMVSQLQDYLTVIGKNSAMVSLQVAVITVEVKRDMSLGLDWAKMGGALGASAVAPGLIKGQALSFLGGDGFGYKFASGSFSLTGALKAFSTYGDARTDQNVTLGTLSGLPVKISSGSEIPYVKSVGASTTAGGATSASAQTETVVSGLTLEVTPQFDASDKSVVTQIKVNLASLIAMRDLSAGMALGTLTQPEMQKLTFENVGRLTAGETLIVGGITYDKNSTDFQSLPGLEKLQAGGKTESRKKQAIYIVVRPTVLMFTPDADRLNAELARDKTMAMSGRATKPLTEEIVAVERSAPAAKQAATVGAK